MMKTTTLLNSVMYPTGGSKMNIVNIKTGGFRNLKDVDLSLSSLTALVGLNSYGKSNLIAAIDFGIDFISATNTTRKNMMSFSSDIPINKKVANKNFFFDLDLETTIKDIEYCVNYRFEFEWAKNKDSGSKIVNESLKVKRKEKGQKYNLLISRDEKKAFFKSSSTGRCSSVVKVEKSDLVIDKLNAYDDLYYLNLIKEIFAVRIYVDHHLDASFSYNPDPIIRKGLNALDINAINNIPRAIYYLQQEYIDKYELLINAYMELFPQISQIEVRELGFDNSPAETLSEDIPFTICDKVYMMQVIDKNLNQPINFDRVSDGAKRVFLMLTYAVIADIKGLSLIVFEEPENSIHPSLLQRYLVTLSQLVEKCKIIVTSHSPYIVQYIDLSDIYIGIPNTDGAASFCKVAKSKTSKLISDICDADLSTGDYIFDLMSGSQEDIQQLKEYLEIDDG